MGNMHLINIPDPELQIDFAYALSQLRTAYLQDALSITVRSMDITAIDQELAVYVPATYLSTLAGYGLRGELMFPVPCILQANPRLLGYYRLLLGFSRKAFYSKEFGLVGFMTMEDKGQLSEENRMRLPELCRALIRSACVLVDGISPERISPAYLDDLTLLTLGPQLRGGKNVEHGTAAIVAVFRCIHNIVRHTITRSNTRLIEILNAAGRKVFIEFGPDPDIIIREEMVVGSFRNIIAIEVKGGKDYSNIHNRLGEAEKSHQKARRIGYTECWTVINVNQLSIDLAKKESPTTDRFYLLTSLVSEEGTEYEDFKNRIISLTGIRH